MRFGKNGVLEEFERYGPNTIELWDASRELAAPSSSHGTDDSAPPPKRPRSDLEFNKSSATQVIPPIQVQIPADGPAEAARLLCHLFGPGLTGPLTTTTIPIGAYAPR